MREVEALAAIRAAIGNRPYLVGRKDEARIRQVLEDFDFQVLEIEVPTDVNLELLIVRLSEALGFPNPAARTWYEFSDYFQDVERLERGSTAVLIRNADLLLKSDLHEFVSTIYTLLSIAEDIGPWSNSTVRVEYFFMGDWRSQALGIE